MSRFLVQTNPKLTCPSEILAEQVAAPVTYVGFDGILKAGIIEVNQHVFSDVVGFFALALEIGFPIEKVARASDPEFLWNDEKIMAANASTGFNFRYITGDGSRISNHGYGRAFDVNPIQNPYIDYRRSPQLVLPQGAAWDQTSPGTLYAQHELVQFMLERGWDWGGNWTKASGRVDYQHFEKPV